MFNRETALRGSLLIIDRHQREPSGQSMAYAGINRAGSTWSLSQSLGRQPDCEAA